MNKWSLCFKDKNFELEWRMREIYKKQNIIRWCIISRILLCLLDDIPPFDFNI